MRDSNPLPTNQDKRTEKSVPMEGAQTSSQSSHLIPGNFPQKQSSEMKSSVSSKSELSNKDDLLCDDILSCISALDEVIAEFDDCSSLPYPIEAETFASFVESGSDNFLESSESPVGAAASSSSPHTKSNSTTRIQVGNSQSVTTQAMLNSSNSSQRHNSSSQTSFIPSAISHIPSPPKSHHSNKQPIHQQVSNSFKSVNMPRGKEENYQIHKTSHLIHVSGSSPCSSSTTSSSSSSSAGGGARTGMSKPQRKSIPVASSNVNVFGDGGRRSSETDPESISEIDIHDSSTTAKKGGSDTYSKGTSYNILLGNGKPNGGSKINSKSIIHNNPFVSSSRNNNNNSNNSNNSNGVGNNCQLVSTKIMVSGGDVANGSRSPNNNVSNHISSCNEATNVVQEQDQRAGGGVPLATNNGSVPKVKARGQVTTPMSVTQSHVQNPMRVIPNVGHCDRDVDVEESSVKEQWNFPSEKNLPRSLRKTRKTCLLDEDEENGPPSSPGPGYNNQPWTRNNGKYTDNEDEFSSAPVSKRSNFIGNNNPSSNENCKGKNGRDDRWKIYEEVVVNQEASHSTPKTNGNGVSLAKPQYFNAPLVLHIEDQCRNERKSPPQQQNPQQILMRNKDSVSINIQSKNHKNDEEEFGNCKSNSDVTIGLDHSPTEMKTSIAYNISIHDLNKCGGSPADDVDTQLVNANSQSVIIINESNGKGVGNGTSGSCGSGRSSGRSSVNSDNNNSISTGLVGASCCTSNSNKGINKQMNMSSGEMNSKSVVSLNMNGSGSSSSSSGIGMTRGRGQLINNGKSGNGVLGALASSGSSSSSSGGSAAVLDVDDGYLSMINRNEAQILWPEEMIENETFTADELKRISVNLGEEGVSERESHSEGGGGKGAEEKMDYFSDDSLEFEPEGYAVGGIGSQGLFSAMSGDSKGMVYSAMPYKRSSSGAERNGSGSGRERRVRSGCGGGGGCGGARFYNNVGGSGSHSPTGSSPNNLLQYSNVVSVVQHETPTPMFKSENVEEKMHRHSEESLGQETERVEQGLKKGRQHLPSRIPKISSGKGIETHNHNHNQSRKSESGNNSGSGSGGNSPAATVSLRKPCSFFIPLTDSAVSSPSGGISAGATIAEVKQPPRLLRQLTHEIKVGSNIEIGGICGGPVTTPPTPPTPTPTAITNSSSNGQTVELCASAVAKDNASANNSSSTKINSSSDKSCSLRDTERADDFRQPNNSTFLSSTSSPDLSSSDTQPNTGTVHDSAESTPNRNCNSDTSRLSLTSINHFVQEIMETALKNGFDEASINTNQHTNDSDSELRLDGLCDDTQQTPPDKKHHISNVKEQERQNSLHNSQQEMTAEGELSQSSSSSARSSTRPRTTPLNLNHNEADIKINSQSNGSGQRETWTELSSCSSDVVAAAASAPEGCQVRLQVEEIDKPTEPQVDHDHRDKTQHRKNQIETVARLQAAVTTFFTTNENFFSETKRFPAGTPTPTDHSEDTTANRSPSPLSLPSTEETDLSALSPEFTDVPLMNSTRISLVLDSMSSPNDVELENEAFNQNPEKTQVEGYTNAVEISNGSQTLPVMTEPYSFIEDLNEQPPAFIPTPPPELAISTTDIKSTGPSEDSQANSTEISSDQVRMEGSLSLSHPEDSLPLPRLFNGSGGCNNKNIWPGYDRHFGGELLNVKPGNGKSLSSRSQENLLDAVTKERLEKAFATRGQASTLPLNCRPPTSQRRASTFRNMFNKFRRNKQPEQTIPEVPELKDEEVQSITSRDSRKKPGFFSRLFRRSRKH